jgi:hypothetical protein
VLSNGRSIGVLGNRIDVGFDMSSVMRVDNRVNASVEELSEVSIDCQTPLDLQFGLV